MFHVEQNEKFIFILSNQKDWYVIAVGECNHALACMLSPKVYVFLRIDYIAFASILVNLTARERPTTSSARSYAYRFFIFFQKLNASLCFLSPKKHSLFGVPIMAFGPPPYFTKGETGMIGFAYLFLSYYCNAVSQFCVLHFAPCTLHLYFRRLKSFFYFGILNINTLFTTCSTLFVGYVV